MQINLRNLLFKFTLLVPILFSITSNTVGYFPARSLHPGNIGLAITVPLLMLFILYYYPKNRTSILILIYVVYFFILSFFSSNSFESLYGFVKFFVGISMFSLGYFFINSYEKYQTLNKYYLFALSLYLLNLLIANIFKLGTSDYLDDSFYFGAGRVNITKQMLILIFASINLIPFVSRKQRTFLITLLVLAIFITLLGIKRAVLYSFIVGVVLFLFYNRAKYGSIRLILASLLSISVLIVLFPKTLETFEARFSAREQKIGLSEEAIESESRVGEVEMVLNAWLDGDIKHKLIGSELFNDKEFFDVKRMLHIDYSVILSGSGIIGLLLWLSILLNTFFTGRHYLKFFKGDSRFPFLKPAFYSILLSQIILSVAGTIQGYALPALIWLYLGAIIGTLQGELSLKIRHNYPATLPLNFKS